MISGFVSCWCGRNEGLCGLPQRISEKRNGCGVAPQTRLPAGGLALHALGR